MTVELKNINEIIKEVYNGTIHAVKSIVPFEPSIGSPQLINPPVKRCICTRRGLSSRLTSLINELKEMQETYEQNIAELYS